ncbi:MAG: hypothetical protein IH948_00155 [Bacteroidetes bacterium]|nr:hypothetical protein [Bacteroidota bacterium]
MKLEEAKKICKEKAKERFPELINKPWTFKITEWDDGSFLVEYFHSKPGQLPIQFQTSVMYGDEKYMKIEKQAIVGQEIHQIIKLYEYKELK